MPPGCPFTPRCVRADAACREQMPPLVADDSRQLACWHPLAPTDAAGLVGAVGEADRSGAALVPGQRQVIS
jgi:hypothetical protein